MTVHLSARLAWHDRGWDGHVCDAPSRNASCIVLKVVREMRDDTKEDAASGQRLAELNGWLPPCWRDTAAFAPVGYRVTHRDPLERPDLLPVDEEIPPHSFNPAPYRWMREDHFRDICEAEGLDVRGPTNPRKERGWVYEPDRQVRLLERFWGKLETGRSLVFFYVNQGNPLNEAASRILVGAGRIGAMGPQLYFRSREGGASQYPVWSRRITHRWPEEGVLLPYQQYLKNGWDVSRIVCRVPPGSLGAFKYVGEHVTDDVAVGCLERLTQAVEAVKGEGRASGDWDRALAWLSHVLEEVWRERGPYPGLGPLLHFLGFDRGMAWVRTALAPRLMRGEDVWSEVEAMLDGRSSPSSDIRTGMEAVSVKWKKFPAAVRALLETLVRFELSSDQIERLVDPARRRAAGIVADEAAIGDNPYLLAEQDWGTPNSEAVSVDQIDRGMIPDGPSRAILRARGIGMPAHDDPRRVRAVAVKVLNDAAAEGHTLLSLSDFLARVDRYFPEHRACRINADLFRADADFHREALAFHDAVDPPTVALPHLEHYEREVAEAIRRRVERRDWPRPRELSWERLLEEHFGRNGERSPAADEIERRARAEKVRALETLYKARFSVLVGRAGTGKTAVLSVFLNGLEQIHGRRDVLLLAPTGKARVRLSRLTGRVASTIHQFLLRQGWFDPELYHVKREGGQQAAAPTVIIDEASMIPMDLLGVLFRALDLNRVERLILVGDPNQLPPIGPGRPFVDIVAWLESDPQRSTRIARLMERVRYVAGAEDSPALRLADGYLREPPNPGDDEVLNLIARGEVSGDLEVHFWRDLSDLRSVLAARLEALVGIPANAADDDALNRSLGGKTRGWERAESWQILSPTRQQPFGTDALNREIQAKYKANRLRWAREWGGKRYKGRRQCRPFGEQEIVWLDKVIQIVNRRRNAWPRGGLDYVANGEVGLVASTQANENDQSLDVAFSTQKEVTYRYYTGEVDDNLELAYALTVHKAQGSDFDVVFLVIPQIAATLSRELFYTGLTRFRKMLVLLIEGRDTRVLEALRNPKSSDTLLRNTRLFQLALHDESADIPYVHHLIHRTRKGVLVRSKSEVIVADILTSLGISYEYERILPSPTNPRDFRIPDFTVAFEGDTWYWEHLGMLAVPSYRDAWERKMRWYQEHGLWDRVITSEDGEDGSIDAAEIEAIARARTLAVGEQS